MAGKFLLRFALFSVALFAIIAGTGCQDQAAIARAGSVASGELSQNLTTIQSEADAAKPHADTVGQTHLQSLGVAVASAISKLPVINAALSQCESLTREVGELKASFWSYRQKHDFWYTVGAIAIGIGVLAGLYFLTSYEKPIGDIAYFAFHSLTLGVFWVGGKFSEWVKRIGVKVQPATVLPS